MNMFDVPTESTATPMQMDITAIDLALITDDTAAEFVILRCFDSSGIVLDIPMARGQAEQFGESLRNYAA